MSNRDDKSRQSRNSLGGRESSQDKEQGYQKESSPKAATTNMKNSSKKPPLPKRTLSGRSGKDPQTFESDHGSEVHKSLNESNPQSKSIGQMKAQEAKGKSKSQFKRQSDNMMNTSFTNDGFDTNRPLVKEEKEEPTSVNKTKETKETVLSEFSHSSFESSSFDASTESEVDRTTETCLGKLVRLKKWFLSLLLYLKDTSFDDIQEDFNDWLISPSLFIGHSSSFKENWDFLIMITACWNVFMLPISIAFQVQDNTTDIINTFVDWCFIFDIIFVFRTTILDDDSGQEIIDWRIIAYGYLKGKFTIDFLSTVPFDSMALVSIVLNLGRWMDNFGVLSSLNYQLFVQIFMDEASAKQFQLLGVLKLIRVLRLNRIIMYLNLKQDIKASIKLIKLIFFLLMYVHFVACTWFFIVNIKKLWIPPLDYIWGWDNQGAFFDKGGIYKYVVCFYTSCLFLFGNDLGARDDSQIVFVCCVNIMGAIAQANLFGELAVLVYNINKKAIILQEKIDTVNTAMNHLNLPDDIQEEVIRFIKKTQHSQDQQEELNQFSQLIPNSFQQRITHSIFNRIFFKNTQGPQNQDGDSTDFLKEQLRHKDGEHDNCDESASPRQKSSDEEEEEYEGGLHNMIDISGEENSVTNNINSMMHLNPTNGEMNSKTKIPEQVPSTEVDFSNMKNFDELIQKFQTRLCKPEDLLIQRGQTGDQIFFLSKGIIEIYIDDPRYGRIEDEYFELESGSIFGEIGVLLQTKRSAFARAQDYSILEILTEKNFKIICKNNQMFNKIMRNKMQNYQDRKTIFIKEMLRDLLYQTHFRDFGDLTERNLDRETQMLPKAEEEIITDICYMMEEYYYPEDDLIYNKGDIIDGVLFIIEGECQVNLRSSISQEYLLDKLYKRCTYGYHSTLKILKDEEAPFPVCEHRIVSQQDTVLLKLPYEHLKIMRKKSKLLSSIIDDNMKVLPAVDFTTFYTYNKKLTTRQIVTKFKRAVRRLIQINRDKVFRAKLFNLANYKDGAGNSSEATILREFFEEDSHIKSIELSQRAQRNLESKLFTMLTNAEILEDIEIISAQSQIQKKKIQSILDYIRGQLEDFQQLQEGLTVKQPVYFS